MRVNPHSAPLLFDPQIQRMARIARIKNLCAPSRPLRLTPTLRPCFLNRDERKLREAEIQC